MEVLSMRTVRSNREHSLSVGAQHELTITITITDILDICGNRRNQHSKCNRHGQRDQISNP